MATRSMRWFSIVFALCLIAAAAEAQAQPAGTPQGATRQYAVAAALQNRGEYESAAAEWRNFLASFASDPRAVQARHYLGVCLIQLHKYDEAAAEFASVASAKPPAEIAEPNSFFLPLAEYYRGRAGDAAALARAIEGFAGSLAAFPKSGSAQQALFYLAEAEYAANRKRDAAEHYADFLRRFSNDRLAADATYALAVTQAELDLTEEALSTLTTFLTRFPVHRLAAEVHLRRGEALFALGRYEPATLAFRAAAATTGFHMADVAALREAAAFEQLGQYVGAAKLYESFGARYAQSKLDRAAQLGAGRARLRAGDLDRAVELLQPLAAAKGAEPREAAHYLAQAHLKLSQPEKALAAAEAAAAAGETHFAPQLAMDVADALLATRDRRGEAVDAYLRVAQEHAADPLAGQAAYLAVYAAAATGDHARAIELGEPFLAAPPSAELAPDVMHVVAESELKLERHAAAARRFESLVAKYSERPERDAWRVRQGLALVLAGDATGAIKALKPAAREIEKPDLRAEALYLLANAYDQQKDYQRAAQAFADCLEADPQWPRADEALLALSSAYSALDRGGEARQSLERLVRDYPNSDVADRALLRLGELAYAERDLGAAAESYVRLRNDHPRSALAPNADLGLAWTLIQQGKPDAARGVLDRRLANEPPASLLAKMRYARSLAAYQMKDAAAARDDLRALADQPDDFAERSDARYLLALCEVQLKEPRRAVELLEAILRDDASYASRDKVLYELAWAYQAAGDERRAAQSFERLAAEHSHSRLAAESLYRVGEFRMTQKDYASAAEAFGKATDLAGATGAELAERAAYQRGWALYRHESFAEAADAFESCREAFAEGPLAGEARFMEAESRFKARQFEAALALYLESSFDTPQQKALADLHAGQSAAELSRYGQSMEILEPAAKRHVDSPYEPEILYELAWAQQHLDEHDRALELYEQVTAKTEREVAARARFMMGELYFLKKDYRQAITNFFKVAYGYSYPVWQASAHYEAGRCFELLGNVEQAIESYQEVVERFATSDKADLARKRLADLTKANESAERTNSPDPSEPKNE